MLDWHGSGMGDGDEPPGQGVHQHSRPPRPEADLREPLAIPAKFKILFMQGGGMAENAIVPLNLSRAGTVGFRGHRQLEPEVGQEARKYASRSAHLRQRDRRFHAPAPAQLQWQRARRQLCAHVQQ